MPSLPRAAPGDKAQTIAAVQVLEGSNTPLKHHRGGVDTNLMPSLPLGSPLGVVEHGRLGHSSSPHLALLILLGLLVPALVGCRAVRAEVPDAGGSPAGTPPVVEPTAPRPVGEPMPDLVGLPLGAVRALLGDVGLHGQIVVYDETPLVTAQYPSPGTLVVGGETVTAWVGEPPEPPPPPPSPTPASTSTPTPALAEGAAQPVAAAAPHPPRVSPRHLPPLEPGTVLEGRTSWYGEEFAGQGTACGSVFDPDALTLASRELRCGTRVLVTGPSGASVEAIATDWGPAEWTGRRFDVSRAVFSAIDHPGAGVITVTVEVLG